MKKLISLSLTLLLVMSALFVFPANAEDDAEKSAEVIVSADGNYEYSMAMITKYYEDERGEVYIPSTKDIIIRKYIGPELSGKYTVPEKIDGFRVVEIGEEAFKNCGFSKITVGNAVNTIQDGAFSKCEKLETADIRHTDIIKKKAFEGCKKLSKVVFNSKPVYSEEIYFGEKSFYNCTSLKSVKLPQIFDMQISKCAFGYYYDTKAKKLKKVENFTINCVSKGKTSAYDLGTVRYAYKNGFKCNYLETSDNKSTMEIGETGYEFRYKLDGKTLSGWKSSNPKVLKITDKGKITLLQSGKAKISVTLPDGQKYSRTITPGYISSRSCNQPDYGISDYNGDGKTLKLKKGEKGYFIIWGKANSIDSKITNLTPKLIKIVKTATKKADRLIYVKALKKGNAKIKVKVNGVKTLTLIAKVI